MANGGDLERLETQLEATRSEIAGVAGAVSGLTNLVTDLVRRSSSDHQDERWQARLGSLETRLEMLETAIRAEVERMRATAGAVDALSDEFRGTVGGTRNLVDLAGDIGDRLGELRALENQVRGAAQEIATIVDAQLEEDKADRRARDSALIEQVSTGLATRANEVERTITDRVGQLEGTVAEGVTEMRGALTTGVERVQATVASRIEQLASRLDGLVDVAFEQAAARAQLEAIQEIVGTAAEKVAELDRRFDTVARSTAGLPGIEDRFAAQVRDATAWGDVFDRLTEQVSTVHGRLYDSTESQKVVAQAILDLGEDIKGFRTELDTTTEENVRTISGAIVELSNDVRALSRQINENDGGREQLNEITNTLGQVRAQQPQLTVRLDQLAADISELRATEPDPAITSLSERLDALVSAMRNVVAAQIDPSPQLDAIARAVGELPTALPDVSGLTDRVAFLVDQQMSALVDLQSGHTQTAERVERVLSEIAELRATPNAAPDVHVDVDLDPLHERIAALAAHLEQLRDAQPSTDAVVERVSAVVASQAAVLAALEAGQPQVAERVDQLSERIARLSARPEDSPAILERLDRMAAEVAELRVSDGWLDTALAPLAARLETVHVIVDRFAGQPDLRPVVEQLASAVEAIRAEVAASRPEVSALIDSRLGAFTELTDRLQSTPPEIVLRLDQVRAELADLRTRTPDLEGAVAPVQEQLSQLSGDIERLHQVHAAVDRVGEDVAGLRAGQFAPEVITSELVGRLDRITAEIAALRADQPDLSAASSTLAATTSLLEARLEGLAGLFAPLGAQIETLDGRATATSEELAQLQRTLTDTASNVEHALAGIASLRDAPADQAQALTPLVDRLAIVTDGLSAMHRDVTALADSIATLRTDRAQLVQMTIETNSHLDQLVATVADLPTTAPEYPDYTEHFAATNARIERLTADFADAVRRAEDAVGDEVPPAPLPDYTPYLADISQRVDALSTAISAALAQEVTAPDQPDYRPNFEEAYDRIDRLAAAVNEVRSSRPDLTSSFVALTGLLESLQSNVTGLHDRIDALDQVVQQGPSLPEVPDHTDAIAAVHSRLDELQTQTADLRRHVATALGQLVDQQTDPAVVELGQRVEQLTITVDTTREMLTSIEAAVTAPPPPAPPPPPPPVDETGPVLRSLSDQMANLSSDVKSAVRATVGLGADVTSLRSELNALSSAVSEPREEPDDEVPAAFARLEAAIAAIPQPPPPPPPPDNTAVLDAIAAIPQPPPPPPPPDNTAVLDAIAAIPQPPPPPPPPDNSAVLDAISALAAQPVDNSAVLDAIATLMARDNDQAFRSVGESLREVRTELAAIGRALDALEVEVSQPAPELEFDTDAFVASTASAMNVLEGRIDGEFDTVGRQMEALGTLLAQVIDAVHRVEAQIVGAQPGSERMQTAANKVLESLRANVRQRNRRKGPPPQLGTGDS